MPPLRAASMRRAFAVLLAFPASRPHWRLPRRCRWANSSCRPASTSKCWPTRYRPRAKWRGRRAASCMSAPEGRVHVRHARGQPDQRAMLRRPSRHAGRVHRGGASISAVSRVSITSTTGWPRRPLRSSPTRCRPNTITAGNSSRSAPTASCMYRRTVQRLSRSRDHARSCGRTSGNEVVARGVRNTVGFAWRFGRAVYRQRARHDGRRRARRQAEPRTACRLRFPHTAMAATRPTPVSSADVSAAMCRPY